RQSGDHRGWPLMNTEFVRMFRLAMVAVALGALPGAVSAEPQVTIPETEFNFGRMPMSSIVAHTFWVHSTGGDTVFIDTVISGCGCTTIPLERTVLPPGDSVPFVTRFDSKGFRGSVVKRPYFRIRGDTTGHAVKFYAYVVTAPDQAFPLAVSPPVFNYTQMLGEKSENVAFGLRNMTDLDISLMVVDQPDDALTLTLPDSIKAGESAPAVISLLPEYQFKEFNASVTIEINKNDLHRVSIPLFRRVRKADSTTTETRTP
ncbi:MAG: DUF1573 domain-containing protein, partial [Candidatus Zixiibacteriota bacterium]